MRKKTTTSKPFLFSVTSGEKPHGFSTVSDLIRVASQHNPFQHQSPLFLHVFRTNGYDGEFSWDILLLRSQVLDSRSIWERSFVCYSR